MSYRMAALAAFTLCLACTGRDVAAQAPSDAAEAADPAALEFPEAVTRKLAARPELRAYATRRELEAARRAQAELRPPLEAPVAAAPAPAAPPAPAIVQPSSDASHLNNPKPVYPAVSKRLGEQGKIVLRVLIGADGIPQKVEIKQSSGFERLDRQAVDTVTRWRFVPGTRNGVPEAMWYLQPINFVLQQ